MSCIIAFHGRDIPRTKRATSHLRTLLSATIRGRRGSEKCLPFFGYSFHVYHQRTGKLVCAVLTRCRISRICVAVVSGDSSCLPTDSTAFAIQHNPALQPLTAFTIRVWINTDMASFLRPLQIVGYFGELINASLNDFCSLLKKIMRIFFGLKYKLKFCCFRQSTRCNQKLVSKQSLMSAVQQVTVDVNTLRAKPSKCRVISRAVSRSSP